VALLLPLVSSDDGYKHCEGVVRSWADSTSSSTGREKDDGDKLRLKDLLFFLHIPRTGGRAYFRWYVHVHTFAAGLDISLDHSNLRFIPHADVSCLGSFLQKLYTDAQECPCTYDKLRFDPR
jgi:hypothetical protein